MAAENSQNYPVVPKGLLTCSRCEENLQTSCKESILLSCLHTFCKVCVRAGCLPRTGDGSLVECPKCKAKSQKQDIGCSLFFVRASEADVKEDKCVACDEDVDATSHCVQCDEMLCDACVQAHRRVRITKDHTIKTAIGAPGQHVKPIYCQRHTAEKLRLFCEPCERLTCRLCQLESHKDHKYCFMNEAADLFRRLLSAKLKLVDEKRESVQCAIGLINQRTDALSQSEAQARSQIKHFIEQCHAGLNALWKSLSADLSVATYTKKQSLQRKREDVENLVKRIDRCKETIDFATKCGSDAALLCTRRPFLTHLNDVLGAKCQVPNPSHVLDIRFQYDPKFIVELARQGTILVNGVAVERGTGNRTLASIASAVPGVAAAVTPCSTSPTIAAALDSNSAGANSVVATSSSSRHHASLSQQLPSNSQSLQPTPVAGDKLTATTKLHSVPSTGTALQSAAGHSHVARTSSSSTVAAAPAMTSTPKVTNSSTGTARSNQRQASVTDQQSLAAGVGLVTAEACGDVNSHLSITSIAGVTVDGLKATDDEISRQDDRASKASGTRVPPAAQGTAKASSSDAAGALRAQEPDVCAADSSHSPQQPVRQPLRENGTSSDVEMLGVGQRPDQIEADSAAGQDSIGQDYENMSTMLLITDIKSLAPEAGVPNTDSLQDNNLDTTVPGPAREPAFPARNRRWSPFNVSNNHREDDMNEDYCAVCHNGGELMCCDTCPKVYHIQCHVPELSLPHSTDKWSCSLCVTEGGMDTQAAASGALHTAASVAAAASADEPIAGKRKAPLGLTDVEIKLCEHILLQLFCHKSSIAFHFPVQKTVPNYYRMIKEPMDFTSIKKKLLRQHFNHYMTLSEFIADINLVFANCLTYNPTGSELAECANTVHHYFIDLVRQLIPHLVEDAIKLRSPEDVMHKSALKKKRSGTESPILHIF